MQSPLSRLRDAQVRQFLFEHWALSRGRESVNRSLRRRPGFSTILTGSPLTTVFYCVSEFAACGFIDVGTREASE